MIRTAQMAGVAACVGMVWQSMVRGEAKAAAHALRPPAALSEAEFAAKCIKCGQCVDACLKRQHERAPLLLASMGGFVPVGTPYFIARDNPCEMCPDVPCVPVCPTGALDANLLSRSPDDKTLDINKARMGIAVVDPENCLSFLGLRCEVCFRVCPVRDKAITLNIVPRGTSKHAKFEPVIHSEHCTGCGKCENACPTEEAAIRVLRPEFVQGKLGEHYRPSLDGNFQTQDIRTGTDIAPELRPSRRSRQKASGLDYLNRPGEDWNP